MLEDLIDFNLPTNSKTIITIIGVGGGGNNAVNRMHEQGIEDVDFMVVNTDAQALHLSNIPKKVQIGETLTEGRGAGNRADIGEQSAVENIDSVCEPLANGSKMAFIVAGMGGGTGTGAAPVISKALREMGILTVGVVTLPFRFEGPLRLKQAIQGIDKLKNSVDALLVIHNEKLREIYGNLTLSNAFANADKVLMLAVKGIAEIITLHGYINVDFADVLSVMTDGGIAFMGSAEAEGPDRAKEVIGETINSPLLNNNDILGAKKVLLNITSGTNEITVDEIGTITDTIIDKVGGNVNTIWGTCTDETLGEKIRITLVATGFDSSSLPESRPQPKAKEAVHLNETPEQKTEILTKEEPEPIIDPESIKKDKSDIIPLELLDQVPTQPLEKDVEILNKEEFFALDADHSSVETPEEKQVVPTPRQVMEDALQEDLQNEKRKEERLKALNFNNLKDPGQVDEMEKTPAFKRKQMHVQGDMFQSDERKSRYTIGSKGKGLRPDNPFLHDVVD